MWERDHAITSNHIYNRTYLEPTYILQIYTQIHYIAVYLFVEHFESYLCSLAILFHLLSLPYTASRFCSERVAQQMVRNSIVARIYRFMYWSAQNEYRRIKKESERDFTSFRSLNVHFDFFLNVPKIKFILFTSNLSRSRRARLIGWMAINRSLFLCRFWFIETRQKKLLLWNATMLLVQQHTNHRLCVYVLFVYWNKSEWHLTWNGMKSSHSVPSHLRWICLSSPKFSVSDATLFTWPWAAAAAAKNT